MAGKSKKPYVPQVLTANLVVDGEVVYWRADGSWTLELKEAAVFEAAEAEGPGLASADTAVAEQKIMDPYLFAVSLDDGAISPSSVREKIRAKGPTVRLDLGKQAA